MDERDDLAEIRRAVRALCEEFPGEYWRAKDRERAYPGEFVDALTRAGFLAALIPEEFGGSGLKLDAAAVIMEEIQASGCNGASAHAQMYIMNTLLRHGSAAQKAEYLPEDRERRTAPAGVRGVRADQRDRHARRSRPARVRDGDDYVDQRPEDLDQPRRAFGPDAAARPHDPARGRAKRTEGLSIFLVDMRAGGR